MRAFSAPTSIRYGTSNLKHVLLAIFFVLATATAAIAQDSFPWTGEITTNANLRSGPGTNFSRVGSAAAGDTVEVVAANANGSWYRLDSGEWIAAFLVEPVENTIPEDAVAAVVTNIVDGDTIDVRLNGRTSRVRYILINTPERGQDYFAEATAANRELVLGETVYLEKDVSETDRYSRLLRYVYLSDGTMVNEELVRLGFAQIATFPPDVKYEERIRAAQQEAMTAGLGLWADAPAVATSTPRATAAATAAPQATGASANRNANLRGGPGTNFPVAGSVTSGQALDIVGRNSAGDWYQLRSGAWIAAFLVTNAPSVPVAQNIPSAPAATATSAPALQAAAPAAAPTATSVPAAAPAGNANVVIRSVNYDGAVARVESDEYAVIANTGTASINLAGWRLNAGDNGQDFRFPSYELAPGASCRVYTNQIHPESCGFSFGIGRAIWNNSGDCGYLYNASGQEASRYCY